MLPAPHAYLGGMMMRVLILATGLAGPAAAQTDLVSGSLRAGWQTEAGTRMAAIQLTLAPGWKTYWRAPGDAGIPPAFDWSRSDNLGSVTIHWPRPEVFNINGMTTIGYADQVILPVELRPRDPSRPMTVSADIDLGVCRDICVPATLRLSADLAAPGGPDAMIRAALDARPLPARAAGLTGIACRVEPEADGLRIEARIDLPATGGAETVVFEAGPGVWVDESRVTRDGNRLTAVTEMVGPSGGAFALDRSAVTVTVLGRDRAVEISGCPAD